MKTATANSLSQTLDEFAAQHRETSNLLNASPDRRLIGIRPWEELLESVSTLCHSQIQVLEQLVVDDGLDVAKQALREHRLHVEFLLQSAFVRHAYFKPRGYAGDMELMRMITTRAEWGTTNYAVALNEVFLALPAADAVRNRVAAIQGLLASLPDKSCILNLASGPADEVFEFCEKYPERDLRFDLIDHDIATIGYVARKMAAKSSIRPFIGNALKIIKGGRIVARPRPAFHRYCDPTKDFQGIRQLLVPCKYQLSRLHREHYDLVYSAGLYDYIRASEPGSGKGAAGLTRRLFELVRPGGLLVIGNYFTPGIDGNPHQPSHRLMMELFSEWNLLYRSEADVLAFLGELDQGSYDVQLTDESLVPHRRKGAMRFLTIRKS